MSAPKLERINQHIIYMPAAHTTDRPILAAISGEKRTLVMDAGNSPAHAQLFFELLAPYNLPPLELLVITHWHWDHVFGIKQMNLPTIAHVETRKALEKLAPLAWTDEALDQRVADGGEIEFCAEMMKKEFPHSREEIHIELPSILIEHKLEIDLGGLTVIIEHVGGDHAHDSCILYVKETKTLFLGDAAYPAIYAPKRYYSVDKTLALLDTIESYDADIYVESHYKPVAQATFMKLAKEMRTLALLTREHQGEREVITRAFGEQLGRELGEEDHELIYLFVNGIF